MIPKTIPDEPEEFPLRTPQPEIEPLDDPAEPEIPQEDNEHLPPEIPPLPDDLPPEVPPHEPGEQRL
ncbi:hypothetical protein HH214_09175 [Mucilaginibacter robiniae]|uniref:Uncharacterized protein n=1 Tax=Mucilaginibacter robiniae TaxID=2728022 RepID=A0A7L5E309_9SPHI|nr:hypothetical protein [Mucilaginibacter robiniae]QJD96034.1 hypothetical protein HH214_09175 [Mucilaginibacter robiniae]